MVVPTARLIRVALAPLLGAVLVLSGCSRPGPDSAEAALYEYVAAVNARDRAALEKLMTPTGGPTGADADWVLRNAPAGKMTIHEFRIERGSIPQVAYGYVKWDYNGGVPKDGKFVFGHEDLPDGPWTVNLLYEGPDSRPSPKPSRSSTRK
ncbi:MAG: hypothetical protein U0904_06105 [Candidatus Nanopelagicales bacterium]|nr:hypothetical protein [Candidatus Nanopelagicales bacterium]